MRTEWEHSGWMIDFSAEEWSKTSLKLVGFLEWAWLFSSPQISFRLEVRPLERSPQKLNLSLLKHSKPLCVFDIIVLLEHLNLSRFRSSSC